ncbi:MAG: methyltransferase [Clostridiales bacterium]|nr:methyltransferase [Clostridiales bacterium]
MAIPKFDPKELEVVEEVRGFYNAPPTPIYKFPVTPKEAYIAAYKGSPVWQITGLEQIMFAPAVNPDNIARAFCIDGTKTPPQDGLVPDMFGIEWEFVRKVGGSMVRPGKPYLSDANEWYEKIVWPDIDKWDWEGAAKANESYLSDTKFNVCWFLNGWYERLISFMEFENAAFALIDDDQKQAVKDLFDKLSDLYIRIFDKYLTYFPKIDGFCIHDDWGSQKETFFSPATAEEMIVPYMKRVTDYLHERGKFCDLHSCGQALKQIPNFIKAGWDSWSGQAMNDTHKIYELYGDKILLGVLPEMFDPAKLSEEEQRAKAREYADKFCRPDKPSIFGFYGSPVLTPAYREELYKQSRINYGK